MFDGEGFCSPRQPHVQISFLPRAYPQIKISVAALINVWGDSLVDVSVVLFDLHAENYTFFDKCSDNFLQIFFR